MESLGTNCDQDGSTLIIETVTKLEVQDIPDNNHFGCYTRHKLESNHDECSKSASLCVELASSNSRKLRNHDTFGESDVKSWSLQRLHTDGGSMTISETEDISVKESYPEKNASEWDTIGGNADITAAFEGKMILEADLQSILAWASPIAWEIFLEQARYIK
jgi:hypothetical protein